METTSEPATQAPFSPFPSSFSQEFGPSTQIPDDLLPKPEACEFPPEIIATIGNIEIPLDKRFPGAEKVEDLPESSQLLDQAFSAQDFKAYRLSQPGGNDQQARLERRYKLLVSRRLLDLSEATIAHFKEEPADYVIFEEGYNAKMFKLKCQAWVDMLEQMIEDFEDLSENCDDWVSSPEAYKEVQEAMLDLHDAATEIISQDGVEPIRKFAELHKLFPSSFIESIQDSIYWN